MLSGALALQTGLGPLQAIHQAHSRVRQAFTIPEMDMITSQNERLLDEVFAEDFSSRLVSLDEMISKSENITAQFRAQGKCDSSFPTYDGSCNHPNDFSRAMTSYQRLVAAEYCDEKQEPRCSTRKRSLPSERTLSTTMRRVGGAAKANPNASYLFTAWGQFLTHDIIQTPDVGKGEVPCDCKENKSCKNISIDKSQENTMTFPCMFVIRSSSKLGRGVNNQPQREQLNQLTPLIDGTTVYGVSTKHKNMLTAPDGMHLKMDSSKFGDFLPTVNDFKDPEVKKNFETADVFNDKAHEEFVAGDTRVLENPTLSSYHTMFARLHNICVDELTKQNPNWKADRVFEEARLIVMSAIKQINYSEHLPVLIGPGQVKMIDELKVSKAHRRPGRTRFAKDSVGPAGGSRANGIHKPPADDNPQIRQEFLVAAYRFGHAMVPEKLVSANGRLSVDNSLDLKDNYFDPDLVHRAGPGGCLRGAMAQRANMVSGSYADATQNNLFKPNNFRHGVDLLSINLARGREHGVGSYNNVRNFCMQHQKFGKFYRGTMPAMMQGWQQIVNLYDSPQDIDLYVGILNEQHMPGAQVGPTAGCIIAEQFLALKKGDRFWHENAGVFSNEQLQEIKSLGLSKVMCSTLEGMNRVAENPFLNGNVNFDGGRNGIQTCDKIGTLNLSAWKQKSLTQAAPAPAPSPVGDSNKDKNPNVDIDHSMAACRLTGPRRKGVVMCGNGQWDDNDLANIVAAVKHSNSLPITGKTAVLKGFPKNSVRRISLANSNDLSDTDTLAELLAFFPNLNELDVSSTGFKNIGVNTISKNNNLFHLKAINSPSSCFGVNLAMKLEANMKKNLKRFIFL